MENALEPVAIGPKAGEIQVIGRTDGVVRPIAVPAGVTKGVFYKVVSAYDAIFRATGTTPLVADVKRILPTVGKPAISAVLTTPEFKEAVQLRGIRFIEDDGLSMEQAAALNILEDFSDGRTRSAKLKSVGVSMPQFNGWLKDPLFRQMYETRIEEHLKDSSMMALSTIMTNAENGDQKAAEKLLEISGRYNPQNAEIQSARAVVQQLVEAIQRHVKDPDVVKSIIADVTLAQQMARIGS